jgi:hypothetical protein
MTDDGLKELDRDQHLALKQAKRVLKRDTESAAMLDAADREWTESGTIERRHPLNFPETSHGAVESLSDNPPTVRARSFIVERK